MDRYFYSVESSGDEKEVHISGNVYFNDADETETDYRIAEYCGFYLSVAELALLREDKDEFADYLNEQVKYLGDITKEEAEDICNTYWAGESGEERSIFNITDDTPCGYYWFDWR